MVDTFLKCINMIEPIISSVAVVGHGWCCDFVPHSTTVRYMLADRQTAEDRPEDGRGGMTSKMTAGPFAAATAMWLAYLAASTGRQTDICMGFPKCDGLQPLRAGLRCDRLWKRPAAEDSKCPRCRRGRSLILHLSPVSARMCRRCHRCH